MRSCLVMAVPIITSCVDLIGQCITVAKMATIIFNDNAIRNNPSRDIRSCARASAGAEKKKARAKSGLGKVVVLRRRPETDCGGNEHEPA